jgi:hypothetical protein
MLGFRYKSKPVAAKLARFIKGNLLPRQFHPTVPRPTLLILRGALPCGPNLYPCLVSPLLAKPPAFTHNSQNRASGGFVTMVRFGNFQFASILAVALAVAMWPAASQAYTPEQQQACSGDAMQLCGEFVPDVDRITACMIRKKSQLSPGCRVYFRSDPEPVANAPAGRPMLIKPAAARTKPANTTPRKPKKPAKPAAT